VRRQTRWTRLIYCKVTIHWSRMRVEYVEYWLYCNDHPGVSAQAQVSSPFYPAHEHELSVVALLENVFRLSIFSL
jgi:hypothetical protein